MSAAGGAGITTPHGRLMLTLLGGIAEFERELIRIRTTEGRTRAVAMGVRLGRPAKMNEGQRQEALRRVEAGEKVDEVAKSYKVSASTISRLQVGGGLDSGISGYGRSEGKAP
jgi:DNA invertase Pin-like site-specific DNA recombinase